MKIYCVIDAQNDFIDGVLGTPEAQAAVPKICEVLQNAIPEDNLFLLTRDTHFNEFYLSTQEGVYLPIPHCIKDTLGWEINQNILNLVSDFPYIRYCNKSTFACEDFIPYLGFQPMEVTQTIEEIIIMGFCTDICVISNALLLKMLLPEVPIKVIADCCAGVTPEKHEAALEVMRSCQIEVI